MKNYSDKNTSYILPSNMNIEDIESLAGELKNLRLSVKSHLILDASKIESITTAGLQLIVSLDKSIAASGGSLSLVNGSAVFMEIVKDEGLENLLNRSSYNG